VDTLRAVCMFALTLLFRLGLGIFTSVSTRTSVDLGKGR
jgi:hypothetical protein